MLVVLGEGDEADVAGEAAISGGGDSKAGSKGAVIKGETGGDITIRSGSPRILREGVVGSVTPALAA